jgi:tetratricopeptide (TPR) repeat protein
VLLAFLGAALLLTGPVGCRGSDNTIEGQVRVTNGGPLPSGVTVKLEVAENIVVAQKMIDATGRFVFRDLTDKYYRIIVTAEGYQPASAQVDMQYAASRFSTVYLTPLGPKKTAPSPSESTTDLAAPKKARKEYEQGHAALEAKDFASARGHFERAIEMDKCYARVLTELGVVLTLEGELSSAENSFQNAIRCDGAFLEPYLQLGILLDLEKEYAQSESILQQGLRVAPGDWQPYYRLGIVQQHAGKHKQAEEEYLKAISLSSAVPAEVHVLLADACLQQREYDRAYTEAQTYLGTAPDGPLAGQARSMLQQVESLRKPNP